MAITFVAAGAVTANATSIAVVAPSCNAGDLLVAAIGGRTGSTTITPPSGWTLAARGTTSPFAAFYTKVATSTDSGGSFAFSSSSGVISGAILAYRGATGVDASTAASATTLGTPLTAPTVTTTRPNEFILEQFVVTLSSGSYSVSGPTTARLASAATSGSANVALAVSDQSQASAGISTAQSATTTGGGTTGAATTISLYGDTAPNAPTLNSPATNATIDRGVTQRFAWTFSDPDAGDSQSKFDLQYRIVGAGAWTAVTGTTPNAFWDAAAGTFAAGNYEWQTRTYDAQGVVGPWSTSSFFTAADAPAQPTITAPVSGGTVPNTATVTWSAPNQTDYQIRRVADNAGSPNTGTVYYDSGDVVSSTARSQTLTFETNNRYEHIQVRIKNNGLWSAWASIRVQVSYTPPTVPVVSLLGDDDAGSLVVTVTNPAPGAGVPATSYNDVYVDDGSGEERKATMLTPNTSWTYWTPVALRDYAGEVRVVAVAANGTTTSS